MLYLMGQVENCARYAQHTASSPPPRKNIRGKQQIYAEQNSPPVDVCIPQFNPTFDRSYFVFTYYIIYVRRHQLKRKYVHYIHTCEIPRVQMRRFSREVSILTGHTDRDAHFCMPLMTPAIASAKTGSTKNANVGG